MHQACIYMEYIYEEYVKTTLHEDEVYLRENWSSQQWRHACMKNNYFGPLWENWSDPKVRALSVLVGPYVGPSFGEGKRNRRYDGVSSWCSVGMDHPYPAICLRFLDSFFHFLYFH